MRLASIVSEFPKTSETFVMRDLVTFARLGADIRVYYLAPYRNDETIHDFAKPVLAWLHHQSLFADPAVWLALARAAGTSAFRTTVGQMTRGLASEPELLAKSLALLPKIAALAEDARDWKADHIHAAFAGHPATAAWIIGRLTGIPYSVSCHAHDIFASQALLDRKLTEAAFVRTISDFNRGFLLSKVAGLRPDRIKIIRCGMDLATLPPLPPPSNQGGLRILFVGRLVPQKGLDVLLKALADPSADPAWRLEVIGDGPEAGSLRERARATGLGPRVNWRGNCRFEEVARAYSETDVVVSPSIIGPNGRTEGIPNVLMEALACTRPVIATRLTGVPELVIDGETGLLVPPADPGALVAALRTVAANPEAATRMAAAGRRIVERHYDLQQTAAAQYAAFDAFRAAAGQNSPAVTLRRPESFVD